YSGVRAARPERLLVAAPAERKPEQLTPQADPEDRHLAEQLTGDGDAVRRRVGITRAVGEEHAVDPTARDLRGRGGRWEHGRCHPVGGEQPQDVALHAEVVGGDPPARPELGRWWSDQIARVLRRV